MALLLVIVGAFGAVGLAACGGSHGDTPVPAPSTSAAASTGSGAATAVPVGSSAHTITVDGRQRDFRVYRPARLSSPAPLVVMIHGGGGSAAVAERSYGWDALAARDGFLVAYPDGSGNPRAWNTDGGCCGEPSRAGVDDVAFVTAMVAQLRQSVAVDPARIYAAGVSNGGMLAYTLACRTGVFAAIGAVSATMLVTCARPPPLSVIAVHGLADPDVPFDGGPGAGPARIDGPAVPTVIADWRRTDSCADPSTSTAGPVTTSTASCPDGRAVELITIAGAGHGWPGSAPKPTRRAATAPPSDALDATDVIWTFFAAHAKP